MDTSRLPQPGTIVVGRLASGGVCFAEALALDEDRVVLGKPGAGRAGDGRIIGQVIEVPQPGSRITMRWDNAFEAYEAVATVTGATPPDGRSWTVSLSGKALRLHRRGAGRVSTMLRLRMSVDGGRPAAGVGVDISEGGMRVLVVGDLPPIGRGDRLDLSFSLGEVKVSCGALIAHTYTTRDDASKGEYGIAFVELPSAARAKIAEMVREGT